MAILVTGSAGFIGSSLCHQLLNKDHQVIGVDSLSDYYSKNLKESRNKFLHQSRNFKFFQGDICDRKFIDTLFNNHRFTSVYHLAAQAGVRLKLNESNFYIDSNIQGFLNIVEKSIEHNIDRFMYASSSSVYGKEAAIPFSEREVNLNPSSIYGVSKLANEKLASVLSKSSSTKFRGLRFFTVYGPWGRPDMAYFKLIASALTGIEFKLYGNGSVKRDFTFIDDIINSMILLENELSNKQVGFNDVVNIGGGRPISITQVINEVEKQIGSKIRVNEFPANNLDLQETCADFTYLNSLINQKPSISFESGLARTIEWFSSDPIKSSVRKWAESVK